ncbi:hypothetical protein P8452_07567 [Trifolium repens]|nr:hypothetical protein P8452_07567 [Trifolium repens]
MRWLMLATKASSLLYILNYIVTCRHQLQLQLEEDDRYVDGLLLALDCDFGKKLIHTGDDRGRLIEKFTSIAEFKIGLLEKQTWKICSGCVLKLIS